LKNRKLFAILTLVAFMMSLLPMAAFAVATGNPYASKVTVEEDTVDADGDSFAEFKVYLYDDDNNLIAGDVYVASSRGGTDKFYSDEDITTALAADTDQANVYVLPVTADGTSFFVASKVAGEPEIAVGTIAPGTDAKKSVYNYLIGSDDATKASVGLIDTVDVTFETTSVDEIVVNKVNSSENSTSITPVGDVYTDNDVASNGLDYYRAYFVVKDASNAPVVGEEVSFSVNKNGATLNRDSDVTDAVGMVDVKVYASKSDTFTLTAETDDKDIEIDLVFGAGGAFDIELVSNNNQLVADDETNKKFEFKVTDIKGNQIDYSGSATASADVDYEVLTEPDGSDISVSVQDDADDGYAVLQVAKFKKEGDYKLRAQLGNGKTAEVSFTVQEQGDITELTIEYDEATIPYNNIDTKTPEVKRLDANGVSKDATTSLKFYIDDASIATIDEGTGVVTSADDSDKLGTVTITVVDTDNDLTASTTIDVVDKVASVIAVAPENTVPGETAVVTVKTVTKDGTVASLGDAATVTKAFYTVSKPSGANVSVNADSDFDADMKEKGQATVEVSSNKAGVVKVQVVVNGMTSSVDVNFAEAAPVVEYGAKNVTMFIGSTGFVKDGSAMTMDQAPFIQDGRTFVPVRMVGEALGAEVEFDAATQVITLVREDLTVTMTVGSNVLTLSDGTTVVSDVAPFIVAETGRTVIPFRAIAEAFGADVEAVFAADGTVTAVTFAQ